MYDIRLNITLVNGRHLKSKTPLAKAPEVASYDTATRLLCSHHNSNNI